MPRPTASNGASSVLYGDWIPLSSERYELGEGAGSLVDSTSSIYSPVDCWHAIRTTTLLPRNCCAWTSRSARLPRSPMADT